MSVNKSPSEPPRPSRKGLAGRLNTAARPSRSATASMVTVLEISDDSDDSRPATTVSGARITCKAPLNDTGTEERATPWRSGIHSTAPVMPVTALNFIPLETSGQTKRDFIRNTKAKRQNRRRRVVGSGTGLTVTCLGNSGVASDGSDPSNDVPKMSNLSVLQLSVTLNCGADERMMLDDRTIDLVTPAPAARVSLERFCTDTNALNRSIDLVTPSPIAGIAPACPCPDARTPNRFAGAASQTGLVGSVVARRMLTTVTTSAGLPIAPCDQGKGVVFVQPESVDDLAVVKRRRLADGGFPGIVVSRPSAWDTAPAPKETQNKRSVGAVRPIVATSGANPTISNKGHSSCMFAPVTVTSGNVLRLNPHAFPDLRHLPPKVTDVITLDSSPTILEKSDDDIIVIDSPASPVDEVPCIPLYKLTTPTKSGDNLGSCKHPIIIEEKTMTTPVAPSTLQVASPIRPILTPAMETNPKAIGVTVPVSLPAPRPAQPELRRPTSMIPWSSPHTHAAGPSRVWAIGPLGASSQQFAGVSVQMRPSFNAMASTPKIPVFKPMVAPVTADKQFLLPTSATRQQYSHFARQLTTQNNSVAVQRQIVQITQRVQQHIAHQQANQQQVARLNDQLAIQQTVHLSRLTATQKLRPVAIDGSNVAFCHGKDMVFSCRGIEICINYFLQRGHTAVKAFVPQFRRSNSSEIRDRHILERLHRADQHVVFTPSRTINGQLVTSYDDRFVLEYAQQTNAVVVSNDRFRDLSLENPVWKRIVDTRLLMFAFADDVFMVPHDPLGRTGPNLDDFLRF